MFVLGLAAGAMAALAAYRVGWWLGGRRRP